MSCRRTVVILDGPDPALQATSFRLQTVPWPCPRLSTTVERRQRHRLTAASSIRDLGTSPARAVVRAAVVSLLLTIHCHRCRKIGTCAPADHHTRELLSAVAISIVSAFRIVTGAAGTVGRLAGSQMPLVR